MLLDRHRVARLIELAALERTLKGPERLLREQDVALLVKAAYDDASEAARADFMALVQRHPTSAWPWSAVQVAPATTQTTRDRLGPTPRPLVPTTPAALVLLRGQVDTADADPGNRLPERGTTEETEWDALQRALDTWDTRTISKWIGPQAWITPRGTTAGPVPKGTEGGTTESSATGGTLPGGNTEPTSVPPSSSALTWRHPVVVVAGATVASTVGVVLFGLRHRTPHDERVKEGS